MHPRTKVGDIARARGGKRLPKEADFAPSVTNHPYIRARDIRGGKITFDDPIYIDEKVYERIKRYTVESGDVCVTIVGANVGDVGVVPPSLSGANLTENAAKLSDVCDECDARFLAYALQTGDARAQMKLLAAGAAQPKLALYKIELVEIPFPPLETQRQIADILSAYDDLIENNTRRIQILEEMARTIYREWFVHFRYPGHESTPLVDSPIGPVPEGWEVVKLADLVSTQYGYTESASTEELGPKFLRGTDINKTSYIDWSTVPYCPISESDFEKYRLSAGDVLVIRMADPGKAGLVEKEIDAVFASYLIRLKPTTDAIIPLYLYYVILSDAYQGYVSGASTGTTRKSASAGVITDFAIALPPKSLQGRFSGSVGGLRRMIVNLLDRNTTLRRTRDLLLPKLLSGDVSVAFDREQSLIGKAD